MSWGCVASNDQGGGTCGSLAQVTVAVTNQTIYYVAVAQYGTASWASGLWWTYTPPSPTASFTAVATLSVTASLTIGAEPSSAATETQTSTPTPTPTSSIPGAATCTLPAVQQRFSGVNNSALIIPDPANPSLIGTVGNAACPGTGAFSVSPTYAINSNPKNVIVGDLGESFVPGGVLTATTCGMGNTLDTVLYVGTGCPASLASFGCVAGNDDVGSITAPLAASEGCTSNLQTLITLPNWQQRTYYVLAAGFSASGSCNVRVTYTQPTVTPTSTLTPSATASASLSTGATPTGTTSSTASASSTTTPTASVDFTVDPSESSSITPSSSATASITATLTQGSTPSPTMTVAASVAPTSTTAATPTPSPVCENKLPLAASLTGVTSVSRNVFIAATSPTLWSGVTCGSTTFPPGPKVVFTIDLGPNTPLGQPMTISTCGLGNSLATSVWAGFGCPTSAASFQCVGGATIGSVPTGVPGSCGPVVTLPVVPQRTVYVVVSSSTGLTGQTAIWYNYQLPTATPSTSASPTIGYTAPGSPSPASASVSTSPAAACAAAVPIRRVLTGLDGYVALDTLASTDAPITTASSSCPGIGLTASAKHAYVINLPGDFPVGGTLTVETCSNTTDTAASNTVLWVGAGCPSNPTGASFRCIRGSNDACGTQSRVVVPGVTKRTYYVLVASATDATIAYQLQYVYTLPTPTTTPSPSGTASPSATLTPAPLFRILPRTDLVGSLVGAAAAPGQPLRLSAEAACRQACLDAAVCDGYSFEASIARQHSFGECFLYVNVTQLIPISGYASGLRESVLL